VAAGVIALITRGQPSSLLNLTFSIGDMWMLMAWYFLDEDIGLLHLASGVLIVSGIFVANHQKK
jgi:drug/metabolite transporter (DMT)-like permease